MSETLRIIPQGQPRAEVDNVAEPPCCQEFETGQELISRLHGPSHGYGSGSGNFLDAEARKQSQYGFQLVVGTRSLDGKLIKTHINDFAAENIHDAQDLAALALFGVDAKHDHFPFYNRSIGKFHDLDDTDQLAKLLDDLFDNLSVAMGGNGHMGYRRIQRRGNVQRFNIEPASAEQACHAGKNPGFIFDKNR